VQSDAEAVADGNGNGANHAADLPVAVDSQNGETASAEPTVEPNGADDQVQNGSEPDAPVATANGQTNGTANGTEADAPDAPIVEGSEPVSRDHWGEPKSSTPILKHLVVGTPETTADDTSPDGTDAKPQKRGWWQRNFG